MMTILASICAGMDGSLSEENLLRAWSRSVWSIASAPNVIDSSCRAAGMPTIFSGTVSDHGSSSGTALVSSLMTTHAVSLSEDLLHYPKQWLDTASNNLHCRAGITPIEPLKRRPPRCDTHSGRRELSRLVTIANTAAWLSDRPENPRSLSQGHSVRQSGFL